MGLLRAAPFAALLFGRHLWRIDRPRRRGGERAHRRDRDRPHRRRRTGQDRQRHASQVSTAPGADGIVRRIERAAREGSTNWAVFALANTGDEQIDRLIVVPHYRMVGSGLLLARPRPVAHRHHHAELGRAAGAAGQRRPPTSSASRSIPARSSPTSPSCAPTGCRSSICGSPTPTRTRSTASRSTTASSSASPACWRCS